MNISDYIYAKIKHCTNYTLTNTDNIFIKENGVAAFIRKAATRKPFRKWKLDAAASNKIDSVLDHCIPSQKPIVFRFWFGGYKLWRFSSAPEVDWAEAFMLIHYCEYLAPIIAAYKPGVELLFESDEVFVERLNNIPESDTRKYKESFETLVRMFAAHFPSNFSITYTRHRDAYPSMEAFEKEYAEAMVQAEKAFVTQNAERLAKKRTTSEMNIRWDGSEDLTALSKEAKQKKIDRSIILHDALNLLPTMLAYADAPNKIPLFCSPLKGEIALGSTKASGTKFWVGTGILEKDSRKHFKKHIVTWGQYERLKKLHQDILTVTGVPGKNFDTISVYEKIPNFSLKK